MFPMLIMCFISLDVVVVYFPRRLALATMIMIILVLFWNIFNRTLLKTDCSERMLRWGIFGEEISYCTIKRLIYQTILSLMVSAGISIFAGHTDTLYFASSNIYRSTGTIDRLTVDENYIKSMNMEKHGSSKQIHSENKSHFRRAKCNL